MDMELERIRLAALYADMNDGELEALAEDWESLTEPAHQALQNEMARRGMKFETESAAEEETEVPVLLDPVTVAEFSDLGEAVIARGLLESGDILCMLCDAGGKPLPLDLLESESGWGIGRMPGVNAGIKLQVNGADLQAAREALKEPAEERNDWE